MLGFGPSLNPLRNDVQNPGNPAARVYFEAQDGEGRLGWSSTVAGEMVRPPVQAYCPWGMQLVSSWTPLPTRVWC